MKFDVAFRHMRSSPALRTYAQKRLRETLTGRAREPMYADLVFVTERSDLTFRCHVYSADGRSFHAKHTGEGMQDAVDGAMEILDAQLQKFEDAEKLYGSAPVRPNRRGARKIAMYAPTKPVQPPTMTQ